MRRSKKPKKKVPMTDSEMSPAQMAADSHFALSYHHAPHNLRIEIVKSIRESVEKSPSGSLSKKEVNKIILSITKTEGNEDIDENNESESSEL